MVSLRSVFYWEGDVRRMVNHNSEKNITASLVFFF